MRSVKAPSEPPPLVEKSGVSSSTAAGGGAGVLAKLSLCLGLFAFLLNNFSASDRFHLSYGVRLGVFAVCAVMVLVGTLLVILAVRGYRRTRPPGVLGFLVAAVAVNAVLLVMMTIGVVRALRG